MKAVLTAFSTQDYQELEAFPGRTVYHTSRWHQFIEAAMGWPVQHLSVRNAAGELVWTLPVVTKRRFGKKVNIALPLSHLVPPLQKEPVTVELPLPQLDIHAPVEQEWAKPVVRNKIVTLDLSAFDSEQALLKSFSESSIVRKIKKAGKSGIRVRDASADKAAFEQFQAMQTDTRIRQGSPMYPRGFFVNLFQAFQGTEVVRLYLAEVNDEVVAGIIYLHYNQVATYAYGASYSQPEYFKLGLNQLNMWEAIRVAFESGCHTVDFGSSPLFHTSLIDYKKKWNGQVADLVYSQCSATGEQAATVDREGGAARMAATAFQRMPRSWYSRISPVLLKMAL